MFSPLCLAYSCILLYTLCSDQRRFRFSFKNKWLMTLQLVINKINWNFCPRLKRSCNSCPKLKIEFHFVPNFFLLKQHLSSDKKGFVMQVLNQKCYLDGSGERGRGYSRGDESDQIFNIGHSGGSIGAASTGAGFASCSRGVVISSSSAS